jgi:hypothetical protein
MGAVRRDRRGYFRCASHRRISSEIWIILLYSLIVKQTSSKKNLTRRAVQSQETPFGGRSNLSHANFVSDHAIGLTASVVTRIVTPSQFRERAMVVTETDWLRMRGLIAEMDNGTRTHQIAGSVLAGSFVSFACLCLSFPSAAAVTGWLWTVGVTLTCCSGVLSVACFLFDRSLDKSRIEKRHSLLKEMDQMQARFEYAASCEFSRKRERKRKC